MSSITTALRELLGLFIDDGAFAASIVGLVMLAYLAILFLPGERLLGGSILIFGCLAALATGVARSSRR